MRTVRFIVPPLLACAAVARAEPTQECFRHEPTTESRLRARFGLDAERKFEGVACVQGWFGGWGELVWGRARRPSDLAFMQHFGAIGLDGRDLVRFVTEPGNPADVEDDMPTFETVDLDGDGVDEVVMRRHGTRHSEYRDAAVYRVHAGRFERVGGVTYFLDRADVSPPSRCSGAFDLERSGRRMLLIVVMAPPINDDPPLPCPPAGRHAFALEGGRLVQVAAPGPPDPFAELIDRQLTAMEGVLDSHEPPAGIYAPAASFDAVGSYLPQTAMSAAAMVDRLGADGIPDGHHVADLTVKIADDGQTAWATFALALHRSSCCSFRAMDERVIEMLVRSGDSWQIAAGLWGQRRRTPTVEERVPPVAEHDSGDPDVRAAFVRSLRGARVVGAVRATVAPSGTTAWATANVARHRLWCVFSRHGGGWVLVHRQEERGW